MSDVKTVPLTGYQRLSETEMQERSRQFYELMSKRRTVREFSNQPIPRQVIQNCLLAAGTAPSGANLQPWHFAVVTHPERKREIRIAAEKEEREFYERLAPQDWLEALAPLGTDANKPFLETAPCLIAVFVQRHGQETEDGSPPMKHYYAVESVGLATGLLIAAVHNAGLASLTHTPSPMGFLNTILGRPKNERPFLLLVVGYPADNPRVPDIQRKSLNEFVTYLE